MKTLLVIVCSLLPILTSAQKPISVKNPDDNPGMYVLSPDTTVIVIEGRVFSPSDPVVEFPGGDQGLHQYLIDNIKYPRRAKKDNIQGTVYVTYVVDAEGKVTDVRVLRGVHEDLDAEALRVVAKMPKWTLLSKGNKKVKTQFTLPIKFSITQD